MLACFDGGCVCLCVRVRQRGGLVDQEMYVMQIQQLQKSISQQF